jgi:hypothetical protein
MKFFSSDGVDIQELEQALAYIKNKKAGLAGTVDETKVNL